MTLASSVALVLALLFVDGVDLEAMGPQFTKKFAGVFPTRTAYLRPVFQKLVGQEVPVTWLEWDGDLRRTPTLTEELANRIGRVIADAPGRRKVIAAHSWGGVLSYLALRRLEETGRIGPGGIDLLLTIHTPLAMPGPDSSAKIGADPARYGVKGTVNWYVKEEVRPLRSVRLWKNYFSAEDWLSGSIPAAQENMDTHLDHSASYLSPAMQAEYAKVIAGTRDASAGAVSATTPEVPRGDASQGATDGLAWVYGRWAGRIRQGLLSYPAIVTLRKDGAKLAGEMEYPSVPCRSRLTLVEARGEALVLTERVESGRCAGGSVVVRRSRDAGLLWEHVGATGKVLASGTLVRKEP
jgi:hypothetical protein